MTRLFNRSVAVTLAKPEGFFVQRPNAIVIKNLRVAFSIEKHTGSEPNTCTATVTNLSEGSRNEFKTKPLYVRVEAGYDGELQRIFSGDVRWVESMRDGVDWQTRFQLGDGDRAYRHARVARSFKPGTKLEKAVLETARAFGVDLPRSIMGAREFATEFVSGITLQGPAQREMTRLLRPHNMEWSFQDGKIQVLRKSEGRGEAAAIISQDTGMVGTPEFGAPSEKGKAPTLTVRTLLYPSITPGGLIQVDSKSVRGVFKVERLVHEGDTHGDEWYTTIEAKSL